jgi:hypothetical protein
MDLLVPSAYIGRAAAQPIATEEMRVDLWEQSMQKVESQQKQQQRQ